MTETLASGQILLLIPLVALTAGAYASVGLGGGTGYLAIMTLVGMPATTMTSTALLLNLVVTGAALIRFGLAGRLKVRLFLPFLIPAMPAAFLGGLITANQKVFLVLLAAALAIAGIAMLRNIPTSQEHNNGPDRIRLLAVAIPSGLIIGLLSGFLGIGGGVFLGPLILFLGWAGPKEVAAMNSALILALSAIALSAHGIRGAVQFSVVLPLAAAALIGGLAGATLSEKKLSARALQRIFAVIVLIAAAKAAYDAVS
ncbi:MAG: sulfite exporter TauE/SafE family protein [Kiritimatiellales bacterium]